MIHSLGIQTQQGFKKFFEDLFPCVYSLLQKYTQENETAWDLTQEAFLKLYERRADFDNLESARAFVYAVAKNLFLNYYKREKLRRDVYADLNIQEIDTDNFLSNVVEEETLRLLYVAINHLSGQKKTIILLNLQGKNNMEVAEALNISVNTVKTLKKIAYRNLRELLSKEYWWLIFLLSNYQD